MTMPSETQSVSYQQEGECDMTQSVPLMQSTPHHERDNQSTSTTVSELILVSTVDETMPVSTPTVTAQSRVVQRSDDAPNHHQLKHKKRKVEDPYNILVSDEREKVKLEVKQCRLEINKLQMDTKLTQLMYLKETLLVRKLESEMGLLPMVMEPLRDLVNGSADSE